MVEFESFRTRKAFFIFLLQQVTNGNIIVKPVIWIGGGIHAREWILLIAVVMFFLRKVSLLDHLLFRSGTHDSRALLLSTGIFKETANTMVK